MTSRQVLHRLADVALTASAAIGLGCVVMLLAGALVGLRPVVVLSGSMSPSVPAGSLAVARTVPASALHTGDVVTVAVGDRLVTHRIVSVQHDGARATVQLKGDANARPDEQSHVVRSAPRLVASVAGVGRVVAWLSRPPGVFVLAGYAALLLTIVTSRSSPGAGAGRIGERRSRDVRRSAWEWTGGRRWVRSPSPQKAMRTAAAVAAVVALGAVRAGPAHAVWGDPVSVTGSTVGTYTMPAPATFTCGALGVLSVTFNWTAVPGATSYTLHHGSGGSLTRTVTGTSTTVVAAVAGGTAWLQANRDFGSTVWTSAPSASRSYTVAIVSLCA